MNIKVSALSFMMVLFLVSNSAEAKRDCFEREIRFQVGAKVVWDGEVPTHDIFKEAKKRDIPNAKKINKEGILLADLISPHAKNGTLYVQSCGKNTFTAKVKDLLSSDRKLSGYYLALTKKRTLKIVYADGVNKAKSQMKRVSSLKIVTQ